MLEADILKVNSSKAEEILKWKPYYNLEMIIEEIFNWYKHKNDLNVIDSSEYQIEKYIKKYL